VFSNKGLHVTGLDPNPDMLKVSLEFAPDETFHQGTAEEIQLANKSFEFAFLGHVLYEFDDLIKPSTEFK
jgi:ubiquinone/menaquinone biosynthesis C-methylase UbiE